MLLKSISFWVYLRLDSMVDNKQDLFIVVTISNFSLFFDRSFTKK